MIDASDVVIISSLPFGEGNISNLKAFEYAVNRGKMTIMVDDSPIETRDFTGGKAISLWNRLKEMSITIGNDEVENLPEIIYERVGATQTRG